MTLEYHCPVHGLIQQRGLMDPEPMTVERFCPEVDEDEGGDPCGLALYLVDPDDEPSRNPESS
jgi:hypothetical protein